MRKKKKKIGMKWYNFLVYLWLPIVVIVTLISTVASGLSMAGLTIASIEAGALDTNVIVAGVYSVFVGLFMFVYTIELRRSLRTFEHKGPRLLVVWYLLPILFNLGSAIITRPMWNKAAANVSELFPAMAAEKVSQYILYAFLGLILVAFARAFFMILLSVPYFMKREDKFDELVDAAGKDISDMFVYEG